MVLCGQFSWPLAVRCDFFLNWLILFRLLGSKWQAVQNNPKRMLPREWEEKCDSHVQDYLKKNNLIDATFENICPHCVYPQVSAVKKWERHVRFIHSSSNNQLFLSNELICWLILGVQNMSFFTSKTSKIIFLAKLLSDFFTKFDNGKLK